MKILFVVPENYEKVGGYKLPLLNYKKYIEISGNNYVSFFPISTSKLSKKNKIKLKNDFQVLMNKENYDLVIGFSLNPCYNLISLFDISKYNVEEIALMMDCMILHEDSILPYMRFSRRKIKNYLRRILYWYKERMCLKFFKKAVFVSSVDQRYVIDHYKGIKSKVYFLPNGSELPQSTYSRKFCGKNLTIGFLSTYYNDKLEDNVYPFVRDIYPHIKNTISNVNLLLAGKGASDDTVAYFKSIDGVEYIGFVESLDDFYSKVDVIVTVVRKECGILNRVLEAWAYGKPVMGFKKNFKTFENAQNGIHYIAADSKEDFIEAIRRIINGAINIEIIGKNANELVLEYYTWEKCTARFLDIINDEL